jgi:large subunit ribosomal protein L28e
MVHVPDALVWELTRKNNSFMKKANGRTARSGAIRFSVEPGNVQSLSRFQCSGLANSKVVNVVSTPTHGAVLVTKARSKAATQPKKTIIRTPMNKDFRRVESAITKETIANYYRPDLAKLVLAKWTKVNQANRRAKGIIKVVPAKKGRVSKK